MSALFSPTSQDLDRYRSLRALCISLNQRIIKTIPKRAYEEIGEAIGIRHNDVLVFDTEDMTSVLMDCILYDWYQNGKNLIQRFSAAHPPTPGTDEAFLLNACANAKYGILAIRSALPGTGLHCRDVLNGGELFLMDRALSQTMPQDGALATRIIPLGAYWMTGGAGLPITSPSKLSEALRPTESGTQRYSENPGSVPLRIVRACLAAGAADHVAYETVKLKPEKPENYRWPGFKRPRR